MELVHRGRNIQHRFYTILKGEQGTMNKGTLIGFISSDIKSETLNLKSGETMKKVGFNIACNRKGKNAGADFPRLTAYGKVAELIETYLSKGKGAIVDFHIQTGSYTNKDGKRIFSTELVVDSVEFPPVRRDEVQNGPDETHTPEENTQESSDSSDEGFMDVPDDVSLSDLPFRK